MPGQHSVYVALHRFLKRHIRTAFFCHVPAMLQDLVENLRILQPSTQPLGHSQDCGLENFTQPSVRNLL